MRVLRSVAVVLAVVTGFAGVGAASQASAVPPAGGGPAGSWLPPTPAYWPQVVGQQAASPQEITSGVERYRQAYQTVGGAQIANVMDVNLGNPNVRLGVTEASDVLTDPADETISSMANRTGAVAGVNGDFFEIHGTGRPLGTVIINGRLVKSPNPGWPATLGVLPDGSLTMRQEQYTGTVTDTPTGQSHTLASVNVVNDITGDSIVRITPDLGGPSQLPAAATVAETHQATGGLVVDKIDTGVTILPALAGGQQDLVGNKTSAQWLAALKPGDTLTVHEQISPDPNLAQAVSGGAFLVQDGQMAVPVQGGGENNINDPVTGVGVTQDGKHAIFAVFDGHQTEDSAEGLTRPQLAQWMISHGAYNAILFDSGGSSEMVARLPGDRRVSVLNTPSDGQERPVANGLFIYSTESASGPAARAVVNHGQPLGLVTGTSEPVSAYATDAAGNPATDPVTLAVYPPGLASVSGTMVIAERPGTGTIVVRAGQAHGEVRLTIANRPTSLTVTPAAPDLSGGQTQQFTLAGTDRGGDPLTLSAADAHWSVTPSSLGSISAGGLFTAAASGDGMVTVTATVGAAAGGPGQFSGVSATASVAVGSQATVVDPLSSDAAKWAVSTTNGVKGSLSQSATETAQPGDTGSMDVHFSVPVASGVSQLVFYPAGAYNVYVDKSPDGKIPTSIGVWIKGIGGTPGTPLGNNQLTFAESWGEVNGQAETFYPTTVTYNGWQLITANLPAGTQFPLVLNFLDFLVINPSQAISGDLYLADISALYSPRPVVTPPYVAIPKNPSWLRFAGSPAEFAPGGVTIANFDDNHMTAADPGSTGAVVTGDINTALRALPSAAAPNVIQDNGDMADDGTLANLQFAKSKLDAFGLPYHDAVGNHEIGQGAEPENKNWTSLFGPTHYSYTDGAAEFIVADSAHGGLLSSDPYQVPAESPWPEAQANPAQYPWLVSQLSASTSKVIFVVTHMPAYDPHPIANSQFGDRWEAQMYETLLARFAATHPWQHVILLFGHARGFAEQLLSPAGAGSPDGLPNFTVADAGVPAYAPVSQGGFYNYALFHVLPDGDVQFAVQPLLASISVAVAGGPGQSGTAPSSGAVAVGSSEQLTATGTSVTGDDLTALQVPIADPASHVWSSSNPRVATINPRTGELTARSPGTVTVTVLCGGVTTTTTITVGP